MPTVFGDLHAERTFRTYDEANALEAALRELQAAGEIEEIPVLHPEHPRLEEHWFRDVASGEVFRYCPPEFPSRGVWEPVEPPWGQG